MIYPFLKKLEVKMRKHIKSIDRNLYRLHRFCDYKIFYYRQTKTTRKFMDDREDFLLSVRDSHTRSSIIKRKDRISAAIETFHSIPIDVTKRNSSPMIPEIFTRIHSH
jgi:hypothetical protein